MTAVQTATALSYRLAEGPFWDAPRERLLWVDIEAGTVLEGRLAGGSIEQTELHRFDGTVGAVTCAEDGTMLVAAQERLVLLRPDGTRVDGPRIVPPGSGRRCNDGSTDPAGRFVVGTLALGHPSTSETLVRLEGDGRITTLDEDLTLSNGLAWSVDGRLLYNVDTLRRSVFVRDHDPATGETGSRRVHLELTDGHPDGIAMDAEDHLWIAVWGGGEVRRYDPDGHLAQRITVPAPQVSCVAFAGPALDVLVVTTAREGLSPADLAARPRSGHLFTTNPGVRGLPVPFWSPVPFHPEEKSRCS